ncbi:MAG: 6-phosphogluconolactonase [Euryarchaeota archaeon]|nr:6-phosphogluconolactonase [Euryarchaeota archaeon]MDN5339997.1 6-phosphogluconolactonase [Euryarchaeota archaeon]
MTQQRSPIIMAIGVIALIIVAAGIWVVFSQGGNDPVPEENIQEELKAHAMEIAAQIDGDAFAALKPGDETTPEFIAIRDQLAAFRDAHPEILYVYTMRKVGNATEYVVDADYGSGDAPRIGEVYYPTEGDAAFLAGFEEPSAEDEYYTETWGNIVATTISGYAPIRDSSGAVVGLVGVDMGSVKVIADAGTLPKAPTEAELKALATEIAGKIDGDTLAALKPGDETTAEFIAIRDQLVAFRDENPGVIYIYTMRKVGNATEYIVDADYGTGDGVEIGYTYLPTEEDTAFLAGFERPSAEPYYIGEWGDVVYMATSGYAPIKDASGAVVGVVCVDIGSVITEDMLKDLAVEIAGKIDGDALAALKPGDETTSEFIAIRDRLAAFRDEKPGVLYVYTMRKVGDTIEYIVDADYTPGDEPAIGTIYQPTDADSRLLAGFVGPSAESELSTEEWDNATAFIISGYAPVKDSTGAIVGLVGVDMGSTVPH